MPKDNRRFLKIALRRIQLGSLLSNDQNAVTACVVNLVLPPFLYTRPQTHITGTKVKINAMFKSMLQASLSP